MRAPKIGELDKRAVILVRQDRPAGGFDVVETYSPVATRWAKREPVGGSVYVGSAQVGNAITHRIFIRLMDGLGLSHVVDCDGMRHAVKRSTDLNGAGRFTVLEVEELGPAPIEAPAP